MSQQRIMNLLATYIIQQLTNHVNVLMFHTFIENDLQKLGKSKP